MHQVIGGKSVYVVEFDTMPEMPITGLTEVEAKTRDIMRRLLGDQVRNFGTAGGINLLDNSSSGRYAKALNDAIKNGIITEPGKYGIHLVPGTDNYEIYKIVE